MTHNNSSTIYFIGGTKISPCEGLVIERVLYQNRDKGERRNRKSKASIRRLGDRLVGLGSESLYLVSKNDRNVSQSSVHFWVCWDCRSNQAGNVPGQEP